MFHYGHQRKRARTATGSRQLSLGSASPPLPGMPDAGEPRVHGGAAALGNKLRHCDQPPMYPGMRSHLKPQYIDMECLRRQTTTTDKTKFKGLPHKYNLAVPMLKKYVESQMRMIPRRELEAMSDKAKSDKVSSLCYAPSKWHQWLALNVELEKVELISTSTAHMRPFTRQNAAAFKVDMDESEFASSSMKSLCIFVGNYIEECLELCVPRCDEHVEVEARKAASLLNGCSGKYSRYAKADSRHYKRAEDLCDNWLGKQYSHQQTAEVFERCLVEATRLLDMYDFDDPDAQAVVVLQHPAEQLRTVQQLLITCVSIAMMAPREPVVESFKLSWLAETEGGAVTINPGLDAEDFKNLKWEGGAVPTRTELDTALHGYFELTWPATAQHFAGGGMRGTSAGQWATAQLLGASNRQELGQKGRSVPVFFGGVPNELDAVALSDDTDFEKLNKVRDILSKRLSTLKLQRGQTRDALKYCYVDWLGMYKKFDHNTARHMAAWTAYVEWFEQLSHDAQGLPNRFIGMPYAEHVQIAADIMNHSVEVHEQTYLPVSPSKQTRQQLDEQAANALPLGAGAAASGSAESGGEGHEDYEAF